jgi:DnaJ-class molecular chaperone
MSDEGRGPQGGREAEPFPRRSARTHHEVLGVTLASSAEEVRDAYRALSRSMHPDRHGGTAEANAAFAEVTQAYAVLKNDRARYEASLRLLTDPCAVCGGHGVRVRGLGGQKTRCTACAGTGRQERKTQRSFFNGRRAGDGRTA